MELPPAAGKLLLIAQANEMEAIEGEDGWIWPVCFSVSRASDDHEAKCRANFRVMRLNDEREVAAVRAAHGRQ
jgi:hypothetical protein